jgi:hypothetical protein
MLQQLEQENRLLRLVGEVVDSVELQNAFDQRISVLVSVILRLGVSLLTSRMGISVPRIRHTSRTT